MSVGKFLSCGGELASTALSTPTTQICHSGTWLHTIAHLTLTIKGGCEVCFTIGKDIKYSGDPPECILSASPTSPLLGVIYLRIVYPCQVALGSSIVLQSLMCHWTDGFWHIDQNSRAFHRIYLIAIPALVMN